MRNLGMRVFRGLSRGRRTHIVRFYTRSAVETLRSSDQIGSTERVRSIGSTATVQIHGRPRNIPWPQSRSAIHSVLREPPLPPVYFCRVPKCRSLPRCAPRFCIISSRLARIWVLPREEGRISSWLTDCTLRNVNYYCTENITALRKRFLRAFWRE